MSQRSKNLLEAFNQSKAPEKSAEPVAQPRGSAPRVGGPFADSAPTPVRPKEQSRASEPRSSAPGAARTQRERWRTVGLCGVIALAFFFIGRASAPSVEAAPKSPATTTAGNGPAPAPVAPGAGIAQSNINALLDASNHSTILAITYKRSDEFMERAKATQAQLIAQDLPASIYDNPTKKQIYVLVGAAPKQADLDNMLLRVKSASSDRGKQEFTTAYTVPIDNYVVRKTQ